jgi:hypothetical protein
MQRIPWKVATTELLKLLSAVKGPEIYQSLHKRAPLDHIVMQFNLVQIPATYFPMNLTTH